MIKIIKHIAALLLVCTILSMVGLQYSHQTSDHHCDTEHQDHQHHGQLCAACVIIAGYSAQFPSDFEFSCSTFSTTIHNSHVIRSFSGRYYGYTGIKSNKDPPYSSILAGV